MMNIIILLCIMFRIIRCCGRGGWSGAFAEQYPRRWGAEPPYRLAFSNFCFPIDFADSNSEVLYIESATIQHIRPMIA